MRPLNLLSPLARSFAVLGLLAGGSIACADDSTPGAPDAAEVRGRERGTAVAGLQIADDRAEPFVPAEPPTEADGDRVSALGWFMKGRVQQARNEFDAALESYEKALDLDPKAIEVYRAYVPLAFQLGKTERAIARALVLVELEEDPGLMQQLGRELARNGRIVDAIQLLERAAKADSLDEESAGNVSLHRDLSVLYAAAGRTAEVADSYEVLLEALVNPDRYGLSIEQHAALERDPAIDYEKMGAAFLDAERVEKAVRALSIANERGNGRPSTLSYELARLHLANDNPRLALSELETYLDARLQAKGRDAYELLADILEELKQGDDLIPQLEKLAEKDGRNNLLLAYLGDRYVAVERLDDAEKTFTRIVEANRNPLGHVGLAAVHRERGEYGELLDDLVAAFQAGGLGGELQTEFEAIAADEKALAGLFAAGRERMQGENPTLEFVAALVLSGLAADADEAEAAIDFQRYALGKADEARKPAVYDDLAGKLIDAERYDEAEAVLKEAVETVAEDSQKAQYLYRLSQAQELDGRTADALATIGEARKLLPESSLLHYQHGWIHYHAEQLDEAARVFEEVLEEYPDDERVTRTVRFSLSNVYVRKQEWRKAEEVLEVVHQQDPTDPSVNNDLGYLYADRNHQLEKAERMIRLAVEAEPENHAYQDSMGWVLYRLERYEEALPWILKSAEDPDGPHPTIWDHLGDVYVKLGRKQEAIDAYEKGLAAFEGLEQPDPELRESIEKKLGELKQ